MDTGKDSAPVPAPQQDMSGNSPETGGIMVGTPHEEEHEPQAPQEQEEHEDIGTD